jgi:hypothetical protein
VFQAHAAQIQILQNELESLKAQLVNLKGKFSQPASHVQPDITSRIPQGSCHMKYTNLCNEEKRAKPSTLRYLTKRLNHK